MSLAKAVDLHHFQHQEPMSAFFVGIDASKGYADFVIVDHRKRIVEPAFQLDDTFEGHARLYQILERICLTDPEAEVFAAVESTGGYENNWLHALMRFQATLPGKAARINPSRIHSYREAKGVRVTTDAVSAELIAGYMIAHTEDIRYSREDAFASLRRHVSFIALLTKQHTALVNQLESLLYQAHPQLLTHTKDGVPQWVLKLLLAYPTAKRLARCRPNTLAKIPFLTRTRALELIAEARRSVASACDETTEMLVGETAREILRLGRLVQTQQKALNSRLDLPEEVALLKTFVGISDYSAVALLVEFGAIARFASVKKIAAFFGVHPVYKISGDGIGGIRMSKKGSPRVRAMLFLITLTAIRSNPVIAPLYKRLISQGRPKMDAIGVCMHKTLRILYGMLKNGTPFNPTVDEAHRKKPTTRRSSNSRKRRFQHYDSSAPLSRRAKKRRQQKHSQDEQVAKNRMSTPTTVTQNIHPVTD